VSTELLPFFVYGTLLSGQRNHGRVKKYALSIRPARLRGVELWDLGPYPMAILTEDPAAEPVTGELIAVAPEHHAAALAALDRLEGVDPHNPTAPGGLYWRALVEVEVEVEGAMETAWVYLGPAKTAKRGERLDHGDWLKRND